MAKKQRLPQRKNLFKKFFTSVKGKIALLIAFIGGLATLLGNIDSIKRAFTSKPDELTIKGTAVNSDNKPIDKAKIVLYMWSAKNLDSMTTFSSIDGSFDFHNILEKSFDSIRVEGTWKSKSVVYTNRLLANTENSISLTFPSVLLSASENPLLYHYFLLEGHSIDYLLEGKIDSSWEPLLSKRPYIIKNKVFELLREWQNKYSNPNEGGLGTNNLEKSFDGKARFRTIPAKFAPKRLLIGTIIYNDPDILGVRNEAQINMDAEDMAYLIGKKAAANLLKHGGNAKHLVLTKEQFQKVVEVNGHYDDSTKLVNLLDLLTKYNFPPEFIEADLVYNECGGSYDLQLYPPAIALKIIVIENKNPNAIYTLGNFMVNQNHELTLREYQAPNVATKTGAEDYFPPMKMTADDRIIIPLKIQLRTIQGKLYEYGPVDSLISQVIDGNEYAIRKEKEKSAYVSDMHEGGSCPYIFTRNSGNGQWKVEKHILFGFHDKSKEAEQTTVLTRYDGTIEIRELDPETSYIDELYIKRKKADGTFELIRPDSPLLKARDGNYLVMKKGQKVLVNFEKNPSGNGAIELVAFGYYIPNKKRNKSMLYH